MGGCYSHGEGKGREGLGSPPGHTLTCPVTRAGSQGVTSPPGSHPTNPQALGAAEPAETQRAGTDQGPLREPPHGQMFLAVFSAEVSLGAARGWLAYQMQVLQVANYVHWTHHWEVLLATQGPPSHTLFPAPGWFKKTKEATYFSSEEDERSCAAHGTCGGCHFPYSGHGSSHHHALGPIGQVAKSPQAGRAFPQSPEQEPVLTQLLAVSTCCWCRNNPSHDSGAAFVRCS